MQERSSSSAEVRVFRLDYEYVISKTREYADRLVRQGSARLVVLFGSLAKGTHSPFSDIDVLIITEDAPSNPLDRIAPYIDPTLPLDIEPRVLTIEEFLRMAREGRRFIREIIEHGEYLAGELEMLHKARIRLHSLGKQ